MKIGLQPLLTGFPLLLVHAQAQAQSNVPDSAAADHVLLHLLLAIPLIVAFAQLIGRLFQRFGQPPVVGEMFAGIILGPSLLGRLAPELSEHVLPAQVVPDLRVISQLGVVLYMFLVGLELDMSQLRQRVGSAIVISASGIAAPLLLGSIFAGFIYTRVAPAGVPQLIFGAFFCVALSVTAFPVLARIVAERKLDGTAMGIMALTCAAVDDISAWCLLSIIVSFARAEPSAGLYTVLLSAL